MNPSLDRFTESRDEVESDDQIDAKFERECEAGDAKADFAKGDGE